MQRSASSETKGTGLPFWPICIATFGFVATENLLDFRSSLPHMLKLSGGLPILDMRPGYTPDAAYQLFNALGSIGRSAYWELLLTVDIVIPILLTLFLWTAISKGTLWKYRLLAFAGGTADYLENTAILILLYRYPVRLDWMVRIAACLTIIKLVSYSVGFVVALVGYVLKHVRPRSVDATDVQ